jgi:hypothetical protein
VVYFKNFQGHSQNLQQVDTEDENQGPPAQSKLLDQVNLAGDLVDAVSSLAIRVPNSLQFLKQKIPRGRSLLKNRQPKVKEASSTLVAMPRNGRGKKDKRGGRKNRGGRQGNNRTQIAKKKQNEDGNGKIWRKNTLNKVNPRNWRKNRHEQKIGGKGGRQIGGRSMKKQKHGASKNRGQGRAKSYTSGGRRRLANTNKNKRSHNKKNGAKKQKKSG